MYWYASPAKIDALAQSRGLPALRTIALKVRGPFVEAGAEVAFDADLRDKLRKIRKRLERDGLVPPFEDLGGEPGPFFSFTGRASRVVVGEMVLVADRRNTTALLLAGSASNVVGTPPPPAQHISASIDPLGAIGAAFRKQDDPASRANELSFGWQAVVRQTLGATLPEVRGMAILAAIVPSVKAQMRRAGGADLTHIVVGSPIYVEQ